MPPCGTNNVGTTLGWHWRSANETTKKAQHRLVVPWPPSSVNHGRRRDPGQACRNCSLSSSILLTSQHHLLSKSGGERTGEESDSEIKDMMLMLVKRIDFEPYDPWTLLKSVYLFFPRSPMPVNRKEDEASTETGESREIFDYNDSKSITGCSKRS